MAETDGSNVEKTVNEPKDVPKIDFEAESKPDHEDKPKSELKDERKPESKDQPKPGHEDKPTNEVKPEPKHESEDESKNEAKIEKLLAVNRELGIFLEEQLDSILSLRQSVAALQGFIESDPTLKKKYEKYIQSVKDDRAGMPDVHWTNRIRGVLSRLQRTGTV